MKSLIRTILITIMASGSLDGSLRKSPFLITNTDTQCYINTVLQCLMPTPFAEQILQDKIETCKEKVGKKDKSRQLAIMQTIKTYHTSTKLNELRNDALLGHFSAINLYEQGVQGDAIELIDNIVETFTCKGKRPPITSVPLFLYENDSFEKLLTIKTAKLTLGERDTTVYISINAIDYLLTDIPPYFKTTENAQYELVSCVMRTQTPGVPLGQSGHYYAFVKYDTQWYRIDQQGIKEPLTIQTSYISGILNGGFIVLEKGDYGVDQEAISKPTALFYRRVVSPQKALYNLKDNLNLIAAFKQ